MGDRPIASASRIESRYRLVEDFSDFKEVNGFTLPHSYSIQYSVSGQTASLGIADVVTCGLLCIERHSIIRVTTQRDFRHLLRR